MESQEHEALDLGQAVAVWQITAAGDTNVFDLMVLEDAAVRLNCGALEYPEERISLNADSLPAGAHVVICYPKESLNADNPTGEQGGVAGDAPGDTSV